MDPRSRDFVKVGGRRYRREPLDAPGSWRTSRRVDSTAVAAAHEHDPRPHDHEHDHDDHEHDHDHDHDWARREQPRGGRRARARAVRRHALAQIRQYPDVALRMKAHEVTEFDDYLAPARRADAASDGGRAGGRARRDPGRRLQRLFVFDPGEDGRARGRQPAHRRSVRRRRETDEEGCLSLEGVRVPVERAHSVTLEGLDPSGADVQLRARRA